MLVKRMTLSLMAVAIISLLVTGASFALFTAETANTNNTFTAGTVTLGAPTSTVVDVDHIVPGDSGSGTYSVEYTGNVDAWLGLTTALSGDLSTCDGGKFTVNISDGANTYNANMANQVLMLAQPGDTVNLTVDWALDISAGNDCQGDSAQLSMMVKAVQAGNNSTPTGPISWG